MIVISRDSNIDELMSMNLGADDFMIKPYHPKILLAHISAILKRTSGKIDMPILTLSYKELEQEVWGIQEVERQRFLTVFLLLIRFQQGIF